MDWNNLAEDRNKCQTFVNTVMNFQVSKMQETAGLSEELQALPHGSGWLVTWKDEMCVKCQLLDSPLC